MKSLLNIALASGITLFCGVPSVAQNRSMYTPLEAKQCRTIKTETTGAGDYEGHCRGVAGYSLLLLEGDLRQNVIVVTPNGAKHSLELWDVVSGAFSHVGPTAEWRMARQPGKLQGGKLQSAKLSPIALIIRYNASEDPERPNKTVSYLAVAKITPTEICVTDKISPTPDANADARRAADNAATKRCLKTHD